MNQRITKILKPIVPPILLDVYRSLFRRTIFQGNYKTWNEARSVTGGYDADVIVNKVKEALLKVKNGEAVYERDSVLFDEVRYSWPLLAGLLWISSREGNRLNLIDFGGSLGSTYFQNRKFLSHLGELQWNVVEQPAFVHYGKEFFQDGILRFFVDINECLKEQPSFVILLSSVLPYLEKPHELLGQIVNRRFPYVLIDRTPLLERQDDRITIQKVPPEIYPASYPAWFFNRDRLLDHFTVDYELAAEFDALAGTIPLEDTVAKEKGFIFRLKK